MPNYLLNCFILFIPVLLCNALWYNKLPPPYQPPRWNKIPKALDIAENVFRFLVFLLPLNMKIELKTQNQSVGLFLYLLGLVVYGSSWIIQIFHTKIAWSTYPVFAMAPAFTTIIWLLGVYFIGENTFIGIPYIHLAYFLIILAFVVLHTYHAFLIVKKENEKERADNRGKV